MKRIEIGNITIYLNDCFYERINSLITEFKNNWILKLVKCFKIHIFTFEERKDEVYHNMIRVSLNHMKQSQQWRNDTTSIEITNSYISYETSEEAKLYCNDFGIIYGFIRSKISDMIRKAILADSICGLHAGFISNGKECYIIVGNKGNGKTSCIINAYLNNWDIYSDETVFIKNNLELDFLYRMPSLSSSTISHYFSGSDLEFEEFFISQLTKEKKLLIKMSLQNASELRDKIHIDDVKKVFLLVNPDSNAEYHSDQLKHKIISNNWIDGEINSGFEYVYDQICEKCEITNVEKMKGFLRSKCYEYIK